MCSSMPAGLLQASCARPAVLHAPASPAEAAAACPPRPTGRCRRPGRLRLGRSALPTTARSSSMPAPARWCGKPNPSTLLMLVAGPPASRSRATISSRSRVERPGDRGGSPRRHRGPVAPAPESYSSKRRLQPIFFHRGALQGKVLVAGADQGVTEEHGPADRRMRRWPPRAASTGQAGETSAICRPATEELSPYCTENIASSAHRLRPMYVLSRASDRIDFL